MENIISKREHIIPINRIILLTKEKIDKRYPTKAVITNPKGFDRVFDVSSRGEYPCVTVPKKIGNSGLRTNRITLLIWQDVVEQTVVDKPKVETKTAVDPVAKNPIPKKESKRKFSSMIKDPHGEALKRSHEREAIIASKKSHVNESAALKPSGLDGKRILTADDSDFPRGVSVIQNLIRALRCHNLKDGAKAISQKKLLCEFYDVMSFSGSSTIIGLFIALGDKAPDDGNIEAFLKWYQNDFAKVYSPTSTGELWEKGKKFVQGMKPKKLRKNPNPGFSLKNVIKVVGSYFTNKNTGEPFRMKDLHCEVYQPMMLDDERTFVYSKGATPDAKLIDVIINSSLDPNYFQTRKIEKMGISKGPVRRSFDLPIAQHNKDIELVSVGSELIYRESAEELEGITPAQNAFLSKQQNYRIDYEDTKKYMMDNSHKVRYMRIETPALPEIQENSVSHEDLIRCRKAADESKGWVNGHQNQPLLNWS